MNENKGLLILGAGGLGRCAAEIAAGSGYGPIAFLDDCFSTGNAPHLEYPIIGRMEDAARMKEKYGHAIVAIGHNETRDRLLQMLEAAGFSLPALIHKTAYVSPSARIGKGCIIRALAAVEQRTVVEDGGLINLGALIDHDCVIGRCAHVHMGCVIRNAAAVPRHAVLAPQQVIQ